MHDLLPGNTIKIIVGDLNAQVGREPNYKVTIRQEARIKCLTTMGTDDKLCNV